LKAMCPYVDTVQIDLNCSYSLKATTTTTTTTTHFYYHFCIRGPDLYLHVNRKSSVTDTISWDVITRNLPVRFKGFCFSFPNRSPYKPQTAAGFDV
jgi:hypothetical protein